MQIMGVAVIIVAMVLTALLLVVLVLMRETVMLRNQVKMLSMVAVAPAAPSFMDGRVPDVLARRFEPMVDSPSAVPTAVIIFVKSGCDACEALLEEVHRAIRQRLFSNEGLWLVVGSQDKEEPILGKASAVGSAVVHDADGSLRRACQILATPSLFAVRTDDLHLLDYEVGGDIAWIAQRLNEKTWSSRPSVPPARAAISIPVEVS